jgi:hypothetical protein
MKPLVLTALCIAAVAGCDRTVAPTQSGAEATGQAQPSQASSIDFTHPTSLEELQKTFTAAFDAGDKASVEKMIYWGDSSDQNRNGTRSFLVNDAGKGRVVRIEIGEKTSDIYRPTYKWTLASDQLLEIEIDGGVSSTFDWPFGEVDGKYYLGAWNPDPKE